MATIARMDKITRNDKSTTASGRTTWTTTDGVEHTTRKAAMAHQRVLDATDPIPPVLADEPPAAVAADPGDVAPAAADFGDVAPAPPDDEASDALDDIMQRAGFTPAADPHAAALYRRVEATGVGDVLKVVADGWIGVVRVLDVRTPDDVSAFFGATDAGREVVVIAHPDEGCVVAIVPENGGDPVKDYPVRRLFRLRWG